jgi:hypothetical protein
MKQKIKFIPLLIFIGILIRKCIADSSVLNKYSIQFALLFCAFLLILGFSKKIFVFKITKIIMFSLGCIFGILYFIFSYKILLSLSISLFLFLAIIILSENYKFHKLNNFFDKV